MIDKIKLYINNILCEGLNKSDYLRILKDIKIGMEIEVVNDDIVSSYDPLEEYGTWNFESDIESFNDEVGVFNDTLERLQNSLPEKVESVLEGWGFTTLENLTDEYRGNLGDAYSYYGNETDSILNEAKEILAYVEGFQDTLEKQETQFWLSLISPEELEEEVKQLSFYNDKITEYKQELYETINDYRYDINNGVTDLRRKATDTLYDIQSRIDAIAEELEPDEESSFYELKESAEGQVGILLEEMQDTEGSIGDWDIVQDGSLGSSGIEVITPAVSYENFIHFIPKIADRLSGVGFYGDERCGYHIGLSSDKIDIHKLIKAAYMKYQKMGFNKLTSLMIATQQGYKSVYRHNDSSRDESEYYSKALIQHVAPRIIGTDEGYSLEDLLYSNKYDLKAQHFFENPPKFANTNLGKNNYIELRTLGGSNGWDIVNDENKLKVFLYDAISQVFGAIKPLDRKDIVKLMRQQIRKLEEDKPTPSIDSMEIQFKLIAKKVLGFLGDRIKKSKKYRYPDYFAERMDISGQDYNFRIEIFKDTCKGRIEELGTDLHVDFDISFEYRNDEKLNINKISSDIIDILKKLNPEKFGESNA